MFQNELYGLMIKQVEKIDYEEGKVYVVGSHPYSVDSRHFGAIERQDVTGKVIWHIPRQKV